jgi:hypothetical protein
MPDRSRTRSLPRPAHALPAGILALALGFLQACSGGGGGGTAAVAPPPVVETPVISGIWSYTAPTGTVYRDLILPETNEYRSLDSNMAESVGVMSLTGNVLGGTATAYPPAAYSAFYPIMSGTVSGTATSTNLEATVAFPLGAFTAHLVPVATANAAVQLGELAGTYAADQTHTSSGLAGTLTVNADGTFTLVDTGGSGQGTLTQVTPNLNAFRTTLTVTPTTGSPAEYTGLGYLLPETPASIVLMTSRTTGQVSGIFTKQ